MTLILALALLPFLVKEVDQRMSSQLRRPAASDGKQVSSTQAERFDLSELDKGEFQKAFKYQLMAGLQVIETPHGYGLRLGHFLTTREGAKIFACEKYPELELIFSAEGIAISGEIPKMVVHGPLLHALS